MRSSSVSTAVRTRSGGKASRSALVVSAVVRLVSVLNPA